MYITDSEIKNNPNCVNDGYARKMTMEERNHYHNEHPEEIHVPTYVSRLWNSSEEVFHYDELSSRHEIGDYGA